MIKMYSELVKLPIFEERFEYLKLFGKVGEDTFGYERYLNQILYHSKDWKKIRSYVITRDDACDLGCPGYEIPNHERILVHHMNPISSEDIKNRSKYVFDPEYLITIRKYTHDCLHYGFDELPPYKLVERKPNDTIPWKH